MVQSSAYNQPGVDAEFILPPSIGSGPRQLGMTCSAATVPKDAPYLGLQTDSAIVPLQVSPLGGAEPPQWFRAEMVTAAAGPARIIAMDQPINAANDVTTSQDDTTVTLANDQLTVTLCAEGPSIIGSLNVGGCEVADARALQLSHVCDGVRYASEHETSRDIRILASGPVRACAEVHGQHVSADGQPGLNYRLRIELFRDLPVIVMRYWFLHQLPNIESLNVEHLACSLRMANATGVCHLRQLKHGITATPREVTVDQPVHAGVGHQDGTRWRLFDVAPLRDETDYPSYIRPPLDEVSEWFAAQLESRWCAIRIDEPVQLMPKALRYGEGQFDIEVWPRFADTMQLLQGCSRATTVRLAFGAGEAEASQVEQWLAATGPDHHVINPAALAALEVAPLLSHGHDAPRRFDRYLSRVAFPPTVADMFDLGDTPDLGYQRTYLSVGRMVDAKPGVGKLRRPTFEAGGHRAVAMWEDLSDFEPVWANNEYDVIWCMANELVRSGSHDKARDLRWFARHAIEVDFVHFSDHQWKHLCTPAHCQRHTTAGAYPSHFWTEGVLAYYLITGDPDALTFARALGDKIIEFFTNEKMRARLWRPTRELGWALLATAALSAIDPQQKYHDISRAMADMLTAESPGETFVNTAVTHPFGHASIALGVERWHEIDPNPTYRDWLVAFAQSCAARVGKVESVEEPMVLCILHAGYRHCEDRALLEAGMGVVERLMESKSWQEPPRYTKQIALLYRPLSRFFASAHRAGLLKQLDYQF